MSSRIASLTRAQVNALALALLERDDAAREFSLHFMDRYESTVWSPSRLVSVPAATAASRVKVTLRWRPPDALDLTAMRLEDESAPTDITITCGVRTFHAHRALLVQGSDSFRRMFSSGMAEGGGAVALEGVDHTLLEHALTFFYSSVCTLRQDGLLDLLQMSVRLQMHDLSSAVVGAVGNRLHAGNWIGALSLAGELGLPELASLAKQFAVSTFRIQFMSDTPSAPRLEFGNDCILTYGTQCSYSLAEGCPKPVTGADGDLLQLFKVGCDRGVSLAQAREFLDQRRASLGSRLHEAEGFYRSRKCIGVRNGIHSYLQVIRHTNGNSLIIRPCTGWGGAMPAQNRDAYSTRFLKLPDEEAAAGWEECRSYALRACAHGPGCRNGDACIIGKRVNWIYMLSGSSTHEYWHVLKAHGSSARGVLKDRKRARDGPWLGHLQFGEHTCIGVGIQNPGGDVPLEEVVSSWLRFRSQEWKENDFPTCDALFGSWPLGKSS